MEKLVYLVTTIAMLAVLAGITFDWFVSKQIKESKKKNKNKTNYKNKQK